VRRKTEHSDPDDSTTESQVPKLQGASESRKDLVEDPSTVQHRPLTLMASTPVELTAPCIMR
jgi:hypothetical protein